MPKVNVYLPDALAAAVKEAGLPVSAICQRALERVLREVPPLQVAMERPSILGIYGRFLRRAREGLELARDASARRGRPTIDSEDLLAGILEQGSNLGVFIIECLGVSPDDVLVRIHDLSPPGAMRQHNEPLDALLSDDARRVLSLAARHALTTHPDRRYIGNEEILYGLAAADGTLAQRILQDFGIDAPAVARTCEQERGNWAIADYAQLVSSGLVDRDSVAQLPPVPEDDDGDETQSA